MMSILHCLFLDDSIRVKEVDAVEEGSTEYGGVGERPNPTGLT